jgi:1,4-dihydroxy-2-naphthoate octaprenyltransferase
MSNARRQFDRPSPSLAGSGASAAARRAFFATRPPFLVASALPVAVGTAWASAGFHRFDGLLFALGLAATVLAHAAANVYNDVGDDVIGADAGNTNRMYPYTGGSRFIQTGLLSRREMTVLAAALCLSAMALGMGLALLRGPAVMLFGAGLGALPVLGSVWLQTGRIDSGAVLLCIPVSCWVAAILVVNEVPDADADRRAHKRTLVVRWGPQGARVLYRFLTAGAMGACGAAIERQVLPLWYALPALALAVLGAIAAKWISADPAKRPRLRQAIELTLAIQSVGCLSLIAALELH